MSTEKKFSSYTTFTTIYFLWLLFLFHSSSTVTQRCSGLGFLFWGLFCECRLFSRIPAFYSPDAVAQVWQLKISPDIAKFPLGSKIIQGWDLQVSADYLLAPPWWKLYYGAPQHVIFPILRHVGSLKLASVGVFTL